MTYIVEANTEPLSIFYRQYSVFFGIVNTDVCIGIVVRLVVRLVGRCARRDVNRHCKQML